MSVDDIRKQIDALDDRILDLLDDRARLAAEAGAWKKNADRPLYDPEREAKLLARLESAIASKPDAHFPARSVRPVFREIMSACLSVEERLRVAYLGPEGTFTHMAARATFGLAVRYVEATTIAGVFDTVARGAATFGVVPFENSTEGGVTFTLDCLVDTPLSIRSEIELDVAQCLVGQIDELGAIERVYSHPQALAQCRTWLAENLPNAQLVVTTSTSEAALETQRDERSAAVASRLAAELAGVAVLREGIQDRAQNATRFVVLATADAPPTGNDKTSLVFSSPDERGALRRVLEIFDEEGINLSRIESRPSRDKLWQYVFFTTIDGHRADPAVARALERLGDRCEMVKVLGSYPRARERNAP